MTGRTAKVKQSARKAGREKDNELWTSQNMDRGTEAPRLKEWSTKSNRPTWVRRRRFWERSTTTATTNLTSTCFAMDSESIEAFEKLVKEVETGKLKFEKNIILYWLGEKPQLRRIPRTAGPKEASSRSPGSQ
jgi:hypothetical protein